METRGGKREGAGRKPGSRDISFETRERLGKARAKLAEIEVARAEGGLVMRGAALKAQRQAGMMIRDAMLNVPVRVAAQLAAMSDEREIITLLTASIREELTRLADSVTEDAA
jgi:phage terminase Nu1 subunit (DNA packaging protein)